MSDLVLAIDQGTTGTTCLVVRMAQDGAEVIARGYSELPQHFPKPSWVEHDLDEIWASTGKAAKEAISRAGIKPSAIAAIGITNQRETTGVWDVQGKPVHRAIVWQDRRTADRCDRLRHAGHADSIRKKTGLVLDPYFSGTKLAWLLDEVPSLRQRANAGELRFGTIDSWLIYKLTGGTAHVTDVSNASRTMLFNITTQKWDAGLADLLGGVPEKLLPTVQGCSGLFGKTRGVDFLPDGIPIAGVAGDQQAALFGQGCFTPGMAKCTYGTGAFALVNIGDKALFSERGLLTTIAWRLGDVTTYAIEGSTFIAGAIVQWLRDGLRLFESSGEVEALARQVEDTGGVVLVPALTGLGAPYWRPEARGVITGITRGTTRAHIARAALEGIALQVSDLLDAMRKDSGQQIRVLRADGGASANNLLMQFQSDILGVELHRPHVVETTALGAAYLAALGVGMFSGLDDVTRAWRLERVYKPSMAQSQVAEHIARWHAAVAKA